ncbi:unnamed protein product [Chrysoparadoxa australica]
MEWGEVELPPYLQAKRSQARYIPAGGGKKRKRRLKPLPEACDPANTLRVASVEEGRGGGVCQASSLVTSCRSFTFATTKIHSGRPHPTLVPMPCTVRYKSSMLEESMTDFRTSVSVKESRKWEHVRAAIEVQRCWRGHQARKGVWRADGVMAHHMALKIQRIWRGKLGRGLAALRLKELRAEAAEKLNALYWGFKGREKARGARVHVYHRAACVLQQHYRGRLARQFMQELREKRRIASATRLQSHWRQVMGRREAASERANQGREEAILREVGNEHMKGKLVKLLLEMEVMMPEAEVLHYGHCMLCRCHDYDAASDLFRRGLQHYPKSAPLRYASAISLQMGWSSVGRWKAPHPEAYERGQVLMQEAWVLDPDR